VDLPPLLIQTAGSLVAILLLAGLAWWLKLGGAPRLASEADVVRVAGEVEDGFSPVSTVCDTEGSGALARDADGRIMVIRRHGNRFAGRILTSRARAVCEDHPGEFNIIVDAGEARFGKAFLTIAEPDAWADAINALSQPRDA
jgi:hypothetical protein